MALSASPAAEVLGSASAALHRLLLAAQQYIWSSRLAQTLSNVPLNPPVYAQGLVPAARLDLLESDKMEARAASLLHGLGFTKEMQAKKTRDFSGGWRMRIALARALFTPTDLLLLGVQPSGVDALPDLP